MDASTLLYLHEYSYVYFCNLTKMYFIVSGKSN